MIYFIDRGSYKDVIRNDKSLFMCPFCGEWFRALAYHTRQKHGIDARSLREMLGVKMDYQLITPELKERHKELALEQGQPEHLKRVGMNTRFRNGFGGHKKEMWSAQALMELSERRRN